MIKLTIQQEGITLVNIYALKIGAPKYVKKILMNIKGEIDRNRVIVECFNNPLTSMGRSPEISCILYANNELPEREIKTIPLTIASKE